MSDNSLLKLGAAAAAAAVAGYLIGKKMGSKGPATFAERVGEAKQASGKKAAVHVLSPDAAKAYIADKKPLIIDVRDTGDLAGADSIKGAISIPLSNLVFAACDQFALPADVVVKGEVKIKKDHSFGHPKLMGSKARPILVSCGLGGQALIAASILVDYGYTQVSAVDGGNMAWMNVNGEVCDCLKYPKVAVCEVAPRGKACGGGAESSPGCTGTITLTQTSADECVIEYCVKGLTPGKHGFHIHEKADFSDGCVSAGPHYNPFGKTHGAPSDAERHVGDLGNIEPDASGVAKGIITDRLIKIEGEHTVVGRSFMVHADPDDLGKGDNSDPTTKPPVNGKCSKVTGNAGARIACGEIKLK